MNRLSKFFSIFMFAACSASPQRAPPGTVTSPAPQPQPTVKCTSANCVSIDDAVQKLRDRIDAAVKAFGPPMQAPEDVEWVKKKLTHMVAVDQDIRKVFMNAPAGLTPDEMQYAFQQVSAVMLAWDAQTSADLKQILAIHSWIKISVFGAQADSDAWLIVQHADHDPEFQASVLSRLEALYPQGETSARNYAYLFDRVAVSFHDTTKRRPQRYGTQGTCVGPGKWEPFEIEDPAHVDVRRATVGLPPLAEYVTGFQVICK